MGRRRFGFLHIVFPICIAALTATLVLSCSGSGAWDLFGASGPKILMSFQEGVDGYGGIEDTHVIEWAGPAPPPKDDNNAGANEELAAANLLGGAGHEREILIRFDVSSILPSSEVREAALLLYLTDGDTAMKTLYVHRVTGPWAEGDGTGLDGQIVPPALGVTWNTKPSYDPSPLDGATIGTVDDVWYSFTITSAVQCWVENGSSNYGVVIRQSSPSADDGLKLFASSEYAGPLLRPKLSVSYTD